MGYEDGVCESMVMLGGSSTKVTRQMAVAVTDCDIELLQQLAKAAPRKYKAEEFDVLFRAYLFRQQKDAVRFEHVCAAAESVCDAWPEYLSDLKWRGICPGPEEQINMPSDQTVNNTAAAATSHDGPSPAQLACAVVGAIVLLLCAFT